MKISFESLRRFSGHRDEVTAVSFVSGKGQLLTGSFDGTVRLWDIRTGEELKVFGDGREVWQVRCSADEQLALSRTTDGRIRVRRIDDGETLVLLESTGGDAVVSADSRQVLFGGEGTPVRQIDLITRVETTLIESGVGSEELIGCSLSRDGMLAVVQYGDRRVELRMLADMRARKVVDVLPEVLAEFSDDNTLVALISSEMNPEIWCVSDWKKLSVLTGYQDLHPHCHPGIAFTPDNRFVATFTPASRMRMWCVATGEEVEIACKKSLGFFSDAAFLFNREMLFVSPDAGSLGETSAVLWKATVSPTEPRESPGTRCGHVP